jgi:hypothetical protein
MSLLSAEAFGFRDGDPLYADFVEGFLHFVQLEGFDDRLDFLHELSSPAPRQVRIEHNACQGRFATAKINARPETSICAEKFGIDLPTI